MILSQTHTLFLSILSDHLNGRATTLPAEFDQSVLAECALQQQCEGIVYFQTCLPCLRQAYASTNFFSVNRRVLLDTIHDAFSDAHIPYLLFKGTEIARFYPEAALRTMGDSDILVHPKDQRRAHEVLTALGFRGDTTCSFEWHYKKDRLHFELHTRLLYDEPVNDDHLKAWTDRVWEHAHTEDGIRYTMEPDYQLVYLIIHLRKHFLSRGVGFRQFMDLAVTARRLPDPAPVRRYLEELELSDFAGKCFGLCERWFGVSVPFAGEVSHELYEKTTEKVFAGGVFGFLDPETDGSSINIQLRSESRIKLLLKHVFMPYSQMRQYRAFPFLDGRPYLLPAAWIVRLFNAIKEGRTKKAAKNTIAPLVTKKNDDREAYLKLWGLSY